MFVLTQGRARKLENLAAKRREIIARAYGGRLVEVHRLVNELSTQSDEASLASIGLGFLDEGGMERELIQRASAEAKKGTNARLSIHQSM